MTPVAVRDWSPLAGLGAEALRPIQGDAPLGEADLIKQCEKFVALDLEWFRVSDEEESLEPRSPRARTLQAQMTAIDARELDMADELAGRVATTQEGLVALARAALHAMVVDPLCGEINMEPGDDGVPSCMRRQDTGALALGVIASVLGMLGGENLRFVNVSGAVTVVERAAS